MIEIALTCVVSTNVGAWRGTGQLNLCSFSREGLRCLSKPISAVGSGLEVSTDPKDNAITIKNVKILVESREDDKIHYGALQNRHSGCKDLPPSNVVTVLDNSISHNVDMGTQELGT
ncbi:hypothetical protein CsSME_00020045 [Camellia sinensis var. sinensis]